MITNETEIRIAIGAVLVGVLALYGFWGCALVVLIMLLPWKPILAVGGYLVQPLVDWRIQKDRDRKCIAQIEEELELLVRPNKRLPQVTYRRSSAKAACPLESSNLALRSPLESFNAKFDTRPVLRQTAETAPNLRATLAVQPAIRDHLENLSQGVFSNMDLEVEEVRFHDGTAEAYVRFQSPNVAELAIRQRYVLRNADGQWRVESRQPPEGDSRPPIQALPTGCPPMRIN